MASVNKPQSGRRSSHKPVASPSSAVLGPVASSLATLPIFEALLHSAPDAIVIVDVDSHIVLVNRQAEQMFGYSSAELLGQVIELLLPERLRAVHERHRTGYTTNPHTRPMGEGMELVARRKDGSELAVEVSLSPLHTEERLLITSIIRDVTERKRAAEVVARQASLLDLAHDAIIVRDMLSRITYWNRGAAAMYGWSQAEALGQQAHVLLQTQFPKSLSEIEAEISRSDHWEGELTNVRRDGTMLTVASRWALQRDSEGQPIAILELNNDITERKRAEAELEQQVKLRTAYLNTLLASSRELFRAYRLDEVLQQAIRHAMAMVPEAESGALYLYDPQAEALSLRVSVGFEQMPQMSVPVSTGLMGVAWTTRQMQRSSSAAEYQALVPTLSATERDQLQRSIQQSDLPSGVVVVPLLSEPQPLGMLLLLRRRGEGQFAADARPTLEGLAVLIVAAILEAQSREAAATLSTQIADLEQAQRAMTERLNAAESQMLQAARLAAVGELAASIAHEINNPLYAARNSLYLLGKDLPADTRGTTYLTLAREQLARIAGIIERMRDFYRPDRGELIDHDLNALLEGTLALAGLNLKDGRINVVFAPAFDLPLVHCNGDQLRQVFLNLVLNAIEAMTSGGTLTVRTKADPTTAVVEVQDTGIGIAADARAHLFEPFWTNKAHGTGLGLSISAHIVTQHRGRIEVESELGQGSLFRVVLPYQAEL